MIFENVYRKQLIREEYQLAYRENTYAKDKFNNQVLDKNGLPLTLQQCFEFQKNRDFAFLQNKMNTIFGYLKDFDLLFITITQNSVVHNYFNSLSEDDKLLSIKQQKEDFSLFFRDYFKQRLFKSVDDRPGNGGLTTNKRIFVRAAEFHKSFVLHEHASLFIPRNKFMSAFTVFYNNYLAKKDKYNIGRVEIVCDLKYKNKILDLGFVGKKIGGVYCLVYKNTNIKTGEFFYVKFLQNNDESQKQQLAKYVMKYVLKASYNKDELSDREFEEKAVFLAVRIRRVSFNRFLFAKYKYFKLKNYQGLYLNSFYSLRYLTDKQNLGLIENVDGCYIIDYARYSVDVIQDRILIQSLNI